MLRGVPSDDAMTATLPSSAMTPLWPAPSGAGAATASTMVAAWRWAQWQPSSPAGGVIVVDGQQSCPDCGGDASQQACGSDASTAQASPAGGNPAATIAVMATIRDARLSIKSSQP